jgi:hypothetical protein
VNSKRRGRRLKSGKGMLLEGCEGCIAWSVLVIMGKSIIVHL